MQSSGDIDQNIRECLVRQAMPEQKGEKCVASVFVRPGQCPSNHGCRGPSESQAAQAIWMYIYIYIYIYPKSGESNGRSNGNCDYTRAFRDKLEVLQMNIGRAQKAGNEQLDVCNA